MGKIAGNNFLNIFVFEFIIKEMEKNIEEGIIYLSDFFYGHYSEYQAQKQEFCSHDYDNWDGYHEVKQGLIDVVSIIGNNFGNMQIPQRYASVEYFMSAFNEFKSLLEKKEKICEDISKRNLIKYGQILPHVQCLHTMTKDILEAMRVAQKYFDTKPTLVDDNDMAIIERILENFGRAARKINKENRRKDGGIARPTIEIENEYDVQDLLYAFLALFFDDIRKEEPVPSFGAKKSITDFYIPKEKLFIEVKITSEKLKDKGITDQLILDAASYREHPDCKKLIGFIYDPTYALGNEEGLKTALEKENLFYKIIVSH